MSSTVNEYIAAFPKDVQDKLKQLRKLIQTVAPDAVESIAYGMPAYKWKKKPLVYFAGYAHHIGLYATPSAHIAFAKELKHYKQGKGSVQFPLTEPMPYALIEKIIQFKMKEIGPP